MAKKDYFYFKGKCFPYGKLNYPDLEFTPQNWNTGKFYLDTESYNLFMKLKEPTELSEGLQNNVNKDEDGYYVYLRRRTQKPWGAQPPPEIIDPAGQPLRNVIIGNGSDITCKVERYHYKAKFGKRSGYAIDLVSVRVDNLVPFDKDNFSDAEKKQVEGFENVSPQLF